MRNQYEDRRMATLDKRIECHRILTHIRDNEKEEAHTGPFLIAGHGNRRARKRRPAPAMRAARIRTGPRPRGPADAYGERKKGAPRGGSPAAPPRPSPPDTGRAPSTGQRRPALPRADPAVPSALGGLASGFGMGPGVPRPPWPLTGGRRSSCDDENASHAKGNLSACPGGRTASSTDPVS